MHISKNLFQKFLLFLRTFLALFFLCIVSIGFFSQQSSVQSFCLIFSGRGERTWQGRRGGAGEGQVFLFGLVSFWGLCTDWRLLRQEIWRQAKQAERVQNNSTDSLDVYICSSVLWKICAVRCTCCIHLKYCRLDFNRSDNYFLKFQRMWKKCPVA